jgi:tannase
MVVYFQICTAHVNAEKALHGVHNLSSLRAVVCLSSNLLASLINMHSNSRLTVGAALSVAVQAASLADVCTVDHVQASLPATGTFLGLTLDSSSVTANPVYNASTTGNDFFPAASYDYCNLTFAYSHDGRDDKVQVQYWFPAPEKFKNRFLSTGGGGYAINSGSQSFPGGVQYGAAAGSTDGGFGSFSTNLDIVILKANGTIDWDAIHNFGYQSIGELTQIGKATAKSFYGLGADAKIYTYYQGCSEGGREGWSQIQRYGDEYDGVIPGAPAIRYAQQQVQHLYSNVVEKTLDYYPSACELDRIVNATIAFCDPLDGRTDGVVSRTDLCKLRFNVNSTLGLPYSCAATDQSSLGFSFGRKAKRQMGQASSPTPATNGTVSAEAIELVQTIMDGLYTTDGKFAYFSYQPSAAFEDAKTVWNNETDTYDLNIASTGGEFVTRFIQLVNETNLPSLDNVTYDTLVSWMKSAMITYGDTLQTTNPDLSTFHAHGGKILAYHGESDNSIPAASSVHFHESVRNAMYPNSTFNTSTAAMGDWYRLFLVPGAAHCSRNTLQPNGPFPTTNLDVLMQWVERGVVPTTLKAQYETTGAYASEDAQICAWPLRPMWSGDGEVMECEYDQESVDTWMYDFDAYETPLY